MKEDGLMVIGCVIALLIVSIFLGSISMVQPYEALPVAETRFSKLANADILNALYDECFARRTGYRDPVYPDEVPLILVCVDAFMGELE